MGVTMGWSLRQGCAGDYNLRHTYRSSDSELTEKALNRSEQIPMTGGAGFIGRYLANRLKRECSCSVIL